MNIKENVKEGMGKITGPLMAAGRSIKRVTLDDIYTSIEKNADESKQRQEESSRYFNQRIDTLGKKIDDMGGQLNQKIDTQIGQVRQEIGQINQRIDSLSQKADTQAGQLNQKIDTQTGQVNQRLDTVMQMLMDLSKQMMELSKQKS